MATMRGQGGGGSSRCGSSPEAIHRILFPTDFSTHATAAWPYAVGLARGHAAELHLLHVVTPPVFGVSPEGGGLAPAALVDDVLDEALAVLDRLAESARALGVNARTHTSIGDAASEIVTCAAAEEIGLIVMATTGRTGLAHVVMGSVAERVVRHAASPVLTVRHDGARPPALTAGPLPQFRRILAPLDGSPMAEAALPGIADIAKRHGAELRLLRVVRARALRQLDLQEAEVRLVSEAEAYLADVERRLAAEGLRISTAVRYGETAEQILDDIAVRRPDLVAISTHGRTGLTHLVVGSIAEHVLRASSAPVLLFPARAVHERMSAEVQAA